MNFPCGMLFGSIGLVRGILSVVPALWSRRSLATHLSTPTLLPPTPDHPKKAGQCGLDLDYHHLSFTYTMTSPNRSTKAASKSKKPLTDRQRESRRLASAHYWERNREAVLKAGREHAARSRANPQKCTKEEGRVAREHSRESSSRYRAGHQSELALKQQTARRKAYIMKHSLRAFFDRRLAPPGTGLPATGLGHLVFALILPAHKHQWKREASARYRARHRDALLKAGQERGARRHALLKTLDPTDQNWCSHDQRQDARARCTERALPTFNVASDWFLSTLSSRPVWIATDQTRGFTDAVQKGFKKLTDLNTWWHGLCLEQHRHSCPPFKPITFTLNPPASTHPSTNACTLHPLPPATPPDPVLPAGSPFTSTLTSTLSDLFASDSPLTSAESTPTSSPEKGVKKEESCSPNVLRGVGPNTRVQLTPTGRVRGTELIAARKAVVPSRVVPPTEPTARAPHPTHANSANGGPNDAPAPHPSVLMTPARPAAAAGAGGGGPVHAARPPLWDPRGLGILPVVGGGLGCGAVPRAE
ncbi:hypothetical protein K438DRAFT_1969275 [Mycena galopus ATCC 62051]|nr:hypothetical protein K438DRAFT_1969275 [Mycena galopus ATCC 62051]